MTASEAGKNPAVQWCPVASRRGFSIALVSLISGVSAARRAAAEPADDGISRTAEAIHQEVVFKASRARIYEALCDAKQFDAITRLTGMMMQTAAAGQPTAIDRQPGGAFTLFGGRIVGRQVELVKDERIVQAWRVAAWNAGIYSIARFELRDEGTGTRLIFDHAGFPVGDADHLAAGWKEHYWDPLTKYLA